MFLRLPQRSTQLHRLIIFVTPRILDALADVEHSHTIQCSITIAEDTVVHSSSTTSLLQLTNSSVLYSDSRGSRISIL